jgi:acyl-CoA synthetase (NDP forming)
MFDAVDIAKALMPVIAGSSKPVVVSFMGSPLVAEAVNMLRSEKLSEFTFPEDGISALGAAWRYVQYKDKEATKLEYRATKEQFTKVANLLTSAVVQDDFVDPEVVNQIMATYSLPVIDLQYAENALDAIAIADNIGYPVAIKLALSGISHKSDLGGVLLELDTPERVQSGIELLKRRIENLAGMDQMAFGVHIQKMVPKGQELIVGVVRDQVFGPMVMFGAGGTEVEGLGDVEFAIAPLTDMDLDYLIEHTWAGRRLEGYRQHAPADRLAVRDVVINLAQLLIDHPEIKEIEVNPLIALSQGQGCCVVDARMVLESGS